LLKEYPPASIAAVEQRLREALEKARAEYQQAEPEDKAEARELYKAALRQFADLVFEDLMLYESTASDPHTASETG
jgi:hypothetical protein